MGNSSHSDGSLGNPDIGHGVCGAKPVVVSETSETEMNDRVLHLNNNESKDIT